jgi:hypothetical protein
MQSAETWPGNDTMSGSYAMSGQNRLACWVVRNARAQGGMWSFTVVMGNPLGKNRPKMPLVQRNHPIETLAPCRPDEAPDDGTSAARTGERDLGATARAYRAAQLSRARAIRRLREQDECDSRGVVRAARSDLAFDITGKLLSEKQVLGRQLRSGPEHQPQQAQQVSEEGERRSEHVRR